MISDFDLCIAEWVTALTAQPPTWLVNRDTFLLPSLLPGTVTAQTLQSRVHCDQWRVSSQEGSGEPTHGERDLHCNTALSWQTSAQGLAKMAPKCMQSAAVLFQPPTHKVGPELCCKTPETFNKEEWKPLSTYYAKLQRCFNLSLSLISKTAGNGSPWLPRVSVSTDKDLKVSYYHCVVIETWTFPTERGMDPSSLDLEQGSALQERRRSDMLRFWGDFHVSF